MAANHSTPSPSGPALTADAPRISASYPILMYHQIAPAVPADTPLATLTVTPARFHSQMLWMRRLGYRGVSLRELLPYLSGAKHGKVFGITFDDGFLGVLEHAGPILKTLGFSSTCYFVAGQVGGSNVWDRDLGALPAPLMNAAQIRHWCAFGQEAGSHTVDHCRLPTLSASDARHQIEQSKAALEALTGTAVESFCYPYGEATPAIQSMVRDAGYSNATMTHRGRASGSHDLFDLPRVSVSSFNGLPKFIVKCLR